jgi:hypothetical protein
LRSTGLIALLMLVDTNSAADEKFIIDEHFSIDTNETP